MSHKPQAGRAHNLLPAQQNTFSHRVVQGPLAQNRLGCGWGVGEGGQQILAGKQMAESTLKHMEPKTSGGRAGEAGFLTSFRVGGNVHSVRACVIPPEDKDLVLL